MNKKAKILVYISILLFGTIGVYLTFIYGNSNKYDSKTNAYRITKAQVQMAQYIIQPIILK